MAAPEIQVYDVPKICECGAEWTGKSFQPPAVDGSRTPGKCQACVSTWRRELNRVLKGRPVIITPAPPTADQSQPYEKPR